MILIISTINFLMTFSITIMSGARTIVVLIAITSLTVSTINFALNIFRITMISGATAIVVLIASTTLIKITNYQRRECCGPILLKCWHD